MSRYGVYVWLLPGVRQTLKKMADDQACSVGKVVERIVMNELLRQGREGEIGADDLEAYRCAERRERLYGGELCCPQVLPREKG